MLKVQKNGEIMLTRGDTARLNVNINNDSQPYEISADDELKMTVKRNVRDEDIGFQKVVKGGTLIHIKPEDTAGLGFGKYVYDIQLTTAAGDVYTIIGPETFELLQECTC